MKNIRLEPSDCFGLCKKIPSQTWDFLTPCVCICLSGQEERYDRCAKEFCRVGLCRIVDFYRPTKHVLTDKEKKSGSKRAGIIGCFRSHQKVAKEVGLAHDGVTVFEDDVIFRDDCVRHEPAVRESFEYIKQNRPDFFVYFLGSFPFFPQFLVSKHTTRIRGALGAHALHYSSRACRVLADMNIYSPMSQKTPLLYMIMGGINDKIVPKWNRGFIGFDTITSTKENYGYVPMIAFQCGTQCPATSQTTNPKGTNLWIQWVQDLINPTTAKMLEIWTLAIPILFIVVLVGIVYARW